jgi:poly-gamma-glutamate system protein
MTGFSAKSKSVLGVITLLSLIAFLVVENNKIDVQKKWYQQKLNAAILSQKASGYLKNYRLQQGVFIDNLNDPNSTALIGQDITPITTDRGYIEAKLTATNPNFAAVIVEMLIEAGVKKGDKVAISLTGSLPGMNISVLAAVQTLGLKPVIISSVGSSNWGANDPYFTWLDMETVLFDAGIFSSKSRAASLGGGLDKGRGLSPEGRAMIRQAITRNNVQLISEDYLEGSINKRMEIFEKAQNDKPVKAFINVGGGIASLGAIENEEFIPAGLTKILPMKNYPARGVMIRMADKNIPIIHLLNMAQLAETYGLPVSPEPMPEPGNGDIFVQRQYNMLLTIIAASILSIVVLAVFLMEKKRHQLGTEVIQSQQRILKDTESELQL